MDYDVTDDEDFSSGRYKPPRSSEAYADYGPLGYAARPDLGPRSARALSGDTLSDSSDDDDEGGESEELSTIRTMGVRLGAVHPGVLEYSTSRFIIVVKFTIHLKQKF